MTATLCPRLHVIAAASRQTTGTEPGRDRPDHTFAAAFNDPAAAQSQLSASFQRSLSRPHVVPVKRSDTNEGGGQWLRQKPDTAASGRSGWPSTWPPPRS